MRTAIVALLCLASAGIVDAGPPAAGPPTAAALRGTWRGPRGVVRVWPADAGHMRVEFYGLYEEKTPAGPIGNLGEARGVATVDGDALVLLADGTKDCSLTLRLASGRLSVEQSGECPFGRHVTSEGDYRRASSRRPRFGVQP